MKKSFHISDVLSVTTKRVLTKGGMGSIRAVIQHLCSERDEPTDTACILLASLATERILSQCPDLADPKMPNPEGEAFMRWIAELQASSRFVELQGAPVPGDAVKHPNYDRGIILDTTTNGMAIVDVNGVEHISSSSALTFIEHVGLRPRGHRSTTFPGNEF